MLGKTHQLIANLALACLPQKERHILYPRWGGIESGTTLSDEFRIMWEIEEVGKKEKQLVHRCYVDSDNPKDHGCATQSLDHAEGSLSFIQDFLNGDLDGAYNEIEFLEMLGMFLGILSHHVADLCTPVHVGHKIDFRKLGFATLSRFHNKFERDILKYQYKSGLSLPKPHKVVFSKNYFWSIAEHTYQNGFLKLENIYKNKDEEAIIALSSQIISQSVMHTSNCWHTILTKSGMTDRKWSMMPLI